VATTAPPVPAPSLHERLLRIWETPPGLFGVLGTVDHKKIGQRYLVTAFTFMLLGGLEAAAMRAQLSAPGLHLLSPEAYNQLFSMHGITMIFLYASPILSGFSNYIWPLMLGSRDMAFPRVNALSYWLFLFSGLFIYSSFLVGQAPDRGWFAYAPLTERAYSPGLNMDFYALGLLFLTVSTTVGAINFIVTLFKLRAPGMSINRLPIFIWGTLTTSFSMLFALPALTVACTMLYFDRRFGMHFFDAAAGGNPLLWQHLFWIFGHPWVYIVVLPAMGIMSDLIPTFCRRPLVGYTFVALATVSTGILGFGVWVHHMFATGIPDLSADFFSAASLVISIPSAVAVFAWLATIWHGRPVLSVPFLFAAGFIVLFVLGGVSGVATAAVPFDRQLTDSYFVVAHLHYVLVGINVFPVIAGFYFWLPKMTGRLLSERLGRWNFWTMFLGFNLGFFPMHIAGLLGMPRRIYTYPAGMGWDTVNLVTTIGAYVFAAGVLLFLVNVFWSLRRGAPAGANPWDAATLEWATPSPPPAYNFAVLPSVGSRHPLWEDRLQTGRTQSVLHEGPMLDEERETLGVTPLDAEPSEVLTMPEDSLYPFLLALSLLATFYGLLTALWPLAVAGAVLVAAMTIGWLWPAPPAAEEEVA
jgi:cytochrome c oxidase subunit I